MIMMKEDVEKITRKIRKKARIIHVILISMLLVSIGYQRLEKIGNDLICESFQAVKYRLMEREAKYTLLEILRTKTLTAGQAMDIADVVIDQTKRSNVPIHIVLGLMDLESEFRPEAISSEGAKGLLQLMPQTWKLYVPLRGFQTQSAMHDPSMNVRIGIRYLGDLMKDYHGDWRKILKEFGGFAKSSPDTYIRVVMARASRYKAQLGE